MTVIVRNATYESDALRPLIFGMMEAMGGNEIRKESRVLIKPNLLSPALPRQAVLTHPSIVRAAVEYCNERGVRPLVADSPAIGSFDLLLRMSGIRDALRGLDCECRPFQNSVRVDIGEPFGAIEIAEEAVRADFIVNLPKFKTHSQMLLTLAVKNLFGCVVGYRKPEWHMRAGVDRQAFARLLVRIGRTLRPAFNILDGILAMEGQGPGTGGVPRELGVLLAGRDPFAVDRVVCRMLGLDPEQVPVLKAAAEMGFPAPEAEIDGSLPEIRDFRLPRLTPLVYGPKFLHGFIRRQLLQRPVCDRGLPDVRGVLEDLPGRGDHPGGEAASLRLRPLHPLLLLHRGVPLRRARHRRDPRRTDRPRCGRAHPPAGEDEIKGFYLSPVYVSK